MNNFYQCNAVSSSSAIRQLVGGGCLGLPAGRQGSAL